MCDWLLSDFTCPGSDGTGSGSNRDWDGPHVRYRVLEVRNFPACDHLNGQIFRSLGPLRRGFKSSVSPNSRARPRYRQLVPRIGQVTKGRALQPSEQALPSRGAFAAPRHRALLKKTQASWQLRLLKRDRCRCRQTWIRNANWRDESRVCIVLTLFLNVRNRNEISVTRPFRFLPVFDTHKNVTQQCAVQC